MPSRTTIRRCLLPLAALVIGAALSGCHHDTYRASTPPPPPPPSAPTVARTRPVEPSTSTPLTVPAPVIIPRYVRPMSVEVGLASWYGTSGRRAANGEAYDQDALTAASRTLPLGTIARVTNLVTGQAVVVRITDRGPFVPGRILDLSRGAAMASGLYRLGIAKVRIEAFSVDGVPPVPGHWCVQIGAFLQPDDALQLKNDLLRRYGTSVKVITFKGDTGSWVRLTPVIPNKTLADRVASEINVPDPGVEAYVTRTN